MKRALAFAHDPGDADAKSENADEVERRHGSWHFILQRPAANVPGGE